MEKKREKLFSDFAPVSRQQWLDKITIDLKGADFNKKLVWRTNEGFNVQPFYLREDVENFPAESALPGKYPFVRGNKINKNDWHVRQNVACGDPAETNAKLKDLLLRGVDSFGLSIPRDNATQDYLEVLLKDIPLEKTELNLRTCLKKIAGLAKALVSLFDKIGADKKKVFGSIEFDPIGKMLQKGKDVSARMETGKELVEILKDCPNFTCLTVSSLELKNAGAFCYQESGYALSWGVEYLNLLTDAGVSPTEAARRIRFSMGVGANYFMEIAKFRAFRMLWAKVLHEYGVAEDECYTYIMATTTEYNKTLFDSYVNLLRTQTEAMSSALAGVESMVVTAFDAPYEDPTDFSERIARNQQLMLKEENHFSKIVDVAAGSYYVEELTRSLAGEAWKLFLATEQAGGFLSEVKAGKVQRDINDTNAQRHIKVAQRREFVLGSNQFPNFNEKSDGKTPLNGCCGKCSEGETELPKLDNTRLASEFETLRQQTEQAKKRPIAFMLTIGDLKWRQARAQFSCNFLGCAGYEVKDNLGFKTVEEGIEAALKADADIVVLCSSDDEYVKYSVPAFKALAGRAIFIVAGNPSCIDELKAAGIEFFIHVRVNQLDTLKELNAKLGIK
jgi:methylmalonyl-CoA mutase